MAVNQLLLSAIERFFGAAYLALKKLYLLFELALLLLALFLGCQTKMLKRFPGVKMFFFQRLPVSCLGGQLRLHILDPLGLLRICNGLGLKRCESLRVSGFFSGKIECLTLHLGAKRFDLIT